MELHALTPATEINLRIEAIRTCMASQGIDAILLTDNANIFYTLGRVVNGWTYIPAAGTPIYFIRRPEGLKGDNVCHIHKPELIPAELEKLGYTLPTKLGLELGTTP